MLSLDLTVDMFVKTMDSAVMDEGGRKAGPQCGPAIPILFSA
jgi:hypothetical protein